MNITKTQTDTTLELTLSGRLDTATAPDLEAELDDSLKDITLLILEIGSLEYISSAGLRVLLKAHKTMTQKGGAMKIRNANELVREVFEVTGFSDILTIE